MIGYLNYPHDKEGCCPCGVARQIKNCWSDSGGHFINQRVWIIKVGILIVRPIVF